MSENEFQQLEEFGKRLKVIAGIGWVLLCAGAGAGVWATTMNNRLANLEAWQKERSKSIEDYYQFRQELAGRLTRIETLLEELRR